MDTIPLIRLKDLTAGYKKGHREKIILGHISMEIHRGEMVCLAGANGIGKSTLLKTIAGLIPPLTGDVELMGLSITQYEKNKLARTLSVVLTGKIPTGNMKVRELISLGRYPYTNWIGSLREEDRNKVNEAMDLTGTSGYKDQSIFELSDGQMQKALIARALVQDCDIILLDEPTAHLDLVNKILVMKLMKDLSAKTGKAILFASHELDLSMQSADRLLLMKDSRTLVSGTPEDLVINGTIRDFIRNSGLHFDMEAGKFIADIMPGKKIGLEGPAGAVKTWTKKALERCGYTVAGEGIALSVRIDIRKGNNIWEIRHPGGTDNVHSIGGLLMKLKEVL